MRTRSCSSIPDYTFSSHVSQERGYLHRVVTFNSLPFWRVFIFIWNKLGVSSICITKKKKLNTNKNFTCMMEVDRNKVSELNNANLFWVIYIFLVGLTICCWWLNLFSFQSIRFADSFHFRLRYLKNKDNNRLTKTTIFKLKKYN